MNATGSTHSGGLVSLLPVPNRRSPNLRGSIQPMPHEGLDNCDNNTLSTFLETGPMPPKSSKRLSSLGNKYLHSAIRKAVSVLPDIRQDKRREVGRHGYVSAMNQDAQRDYQLEEMDQSESRRYGRAEKRFRERNLST